MIDTKELRRRALDGDLAAMQEIILRLAAAESECLEQARLNGMGAEREAALLAKLEAAEKERDSTMRLADSLALALNTSNHERDNLRAKIAEMEKQEPVAEWIENRFHQYPQLVWNEKYRVDIGDKLYALPGAKGE